MVKTLEVLFFAFIIVEKIQVFFLFAVILIFPHDIFSQNQIERPFQGVKFTVVIKIKQISKYPFMRKAPFVIRFLVGKAKEKSCFT